MRWGLRLLVVLVCALMLSGIAVSLVSSAPAKQLAGPPIVPRSTGSSPKVHVMEVQTGQWCGPCGYADPALSRVQDEWRENMVVIAYHCCTTNPTSGTYDPWYDSTVLSPRSSFYTMPYLPEAIIDGGGTYGNDDPLFIIGSGSTNAQTYDIYRTALEDSADASSNIAISIVGDLRPSQAVVTVTVTATDPVQQLNLTLRTVLYEDGRYFRQNNGPYVHRNVARALNEQILGSGTLTLGQTVTTTVTFNIPPAADWRVNKLGVVSFVQSNDKRRISITGYTQQYYVSDILNAARHDFVPKGVLAYRDLGAAVGPSYPETYEVLLAKLNETYDTWNSHVLGLPPSGDSGSNDVWALPTAADFEDEASVVFWNTAGTNAPILSLAERDVLGAYLDGTGNLLIAGENLGFDGQVNYPSWYANYLHAQYNSDNTGVFTVRGVAGDPISNAWSGTNLNVLATSPDRISAAAGPGNAVPFQYTGGLPGSVRAQHDADSRVVYLGFQYFENTLDTNRADVLGAILNWLDGAAPPKVTLYTPGLCQVATPGSNFQIRWRASDVRIPATGVDLYWSQDGGAVWQSIASGEPNDGLYNWNVPPTATSTARVKVVVHDNALNLAEVQSAGNFIISASTTGVTCNMPFSAGETGWRLVSFPLIPTNPSAASILSSLGASYDAARSYVTSDAADPWKAMVPSKAFNDMTTLDQTTAFWVRITGPGTLSVTGNAPTTPQQITLRPGWNLVGFPSYRYGYTVADLKAAVGASTVEGFDSTASPYYLRTLPDNYILRTGEGYWVYMASTQVWTVPL